jgi:hypothetical protein
MNFTETTMRQALEKLDEILEIPLTLIVGGGGAMILAYHFPLSTLDIDAVPKGMDVAELDKYVKQVAAILSLPPDWLNPYFVTFSHTLPADYGSRLVEVFCGKKLTALALSKEEMLIMKCFAHRQKDVAHAKALIKAHANIKQVERHIESLVTKRIPGAEAALDFLDDVTEQLDSK